MLYLIGKIVILKPYYLIFESNFQGVLVHIASADNFQKNDQSTKLYIYEYKNEYVQKKYGFANFQERILFEDLILIPGIGPRIALGVIRHNYEQVQQWIANANLTELEKLPFITNRISRQIILQLQDKYERIFSKNDSKPIFNNKKDQNQQKGYQTLKSNLKSLGFKLSQIELALSKLTDFSLPQDQLMEQSIKVISTEH